MSVRPMKAVGIIGLSSELDKVMRYCGESEIFHPDDAMNFYAVSYTHLTLPTN